jgi:hypothetical protein
MHSAASAAAMSLARANDRLSRVMRAAFRTTAGIPAWGTGVNQ